MSRNRNRVGFWRILMHFILIVITGGLWGAYLIIKFLLANSR